MSQLFFPEGKKITIAGEEFAIKPFVLRTRTKVLRILADIIIDYGKANPNVTIPDLASIETRSNVISSLITVAGDRLVEIYEITLEKDREWLLNKITLADEIEILQTIAEVNDLPFLLSRVKDLIRSAKNQKTA